MNIIPAIDLLDGKCVRLKQGNYTQKTVYNEDPLEVAKAFEDAGLRYLHVVDLDGACSRHIVNQRMLERIASNTSLHIDFGGGLKSLRDVEIAFESGAQQVTGGSIAAEQPEQFLQWLERYGPDKIILGADARNRKVAINGWQEQVEGDLVDFIDGYVQRGIQTVICTDIEKDGMLNGTSNALYSEIMERTGVGLIASGGVSSVEDLLALRQLGCKAAIVGKAIYEQRITLQQLAELC